MLSHFSDFIKYRRSTIYTVIAKLEWTPSYFTMNKSFFTLLSTKIDKQKI